MAKFRQRKSAKSFIKEGHKAVLHDGSYAYHELLKYYTKHNLEIWGKYEDDPVHGPKIREYMLKTRVAKALVTNERYNWYIARVKVRKGATHDPMPNPYRIAKEMDARRQLKAFQYPEIGRELTKEEQKYYRVSLKLHTNSGMPFADAIKLTNAAFADYLKYGR